MFVRDAVGPRERAEFCCFGIQPHGRTRPPLAAETLNLERKPKVECRMQSDLACGGYSLTPPEITLMWQTARRACPSRRLRYDLMGKGDPGPARLAIVMCRWGRMASAASFYLSPEFNQLLALLQPFQSVWPQRLKPRQQCLV